MVLFVHGGYAPATVAYDLEGFSLMAAAAAGRVTRLTGLPTVTARYVDVADPTAVRHALAGHDVVLSAVPYYFNLELTRAAVAAGVSFCDLGGNTEIVRRQHALDAEARAAGVAVVAETLIGLSIGLMMMMPVTSAVSGVMFS